MEWIEVEEFIETESIRLKERFSHSLSDYERLLARVVKMTEEVGEVCEAVLARGKLQRTEKSLNNEDGLAEEIADVLITALLLAKTAGVDPRVALDSKIKKIKERTY